MALWLCLISLNIINIFFSFFRLILFIRFLYAFCTKTFQKNTTIVKNGRTLEIWTRNGGGDRKFSPY